MLKKTLIFFLISISAYGYSQIPVGTWRDHFSYKKVISVAETQNKIYAAGEVAIFSYDKNEKYTEKLTKIQGFSDALIQKTAYDKENDILIIAYKNSNIDILKNNKIYNLSEIKRKQINTDKTIYNISFRNNIAYLSCGFGIVLIDTDKPEIKDTYFIGNNAEYVKINDIAFDNRNIYAATDQGLFFASLSEYNLADYRNWNLVPDIPDNNFTFNFIEYFNGMLFANRVNPANSNDTLYLKKNNTWNIFDTGQNNIKEITSSNEQLAIADRNTVKTYDKNLNIIKEINQYNLPEASITPKINSVILSENNKLIIADNSIGLVTETENGFEYIYPNGPFNNYTAKALAFDNTLITTDGNNNASGWYMPTYNIFENEQWKSYHISSDTARNFYSIAVNPENENNIYIGSWGYGIFEFNQNIWTNSFNNTNSTLQPVTGYDYGFIRIYDMIFDRNNNLWITNPEAPEPLSVKTKDNQWQNFNFNGTITGKNVKNIHLTNNNIKWLELGPNSGILVFDDNNTPLDKNDDTYKIIIPTTNEGEQISTDVTAFTQDKDGNIWLGTGDGIVTYYNPEDVFEENFFADRIQLTSYGKDTTEQYLLSTDVINDIETDGANRKWIATQNSGAFLVSPNGKEEIYHFDKYNSPLISNTIKDIAVNPQSGEVFFLTELGIMSFRAEATEATETFGNVYVFPNPVRPEYNGKISITGLAENVNVKITDISGKIIYETTALGGQAIWNGKNLNGNKVNTGIYLIFCSDENGNQTFITKLLFIN